MTNAKAVEKEIFNQTFESNMQALKRINITLHDKLRNFKPSNFQLGYDQENNINIKQCGEWLYSSNPKELAYTQYSMFIKKPNTLGSNVPKNEKFSPEAATTLNQLHMNMLYEQHQEFIENERTLPCEYISNMIILGTGLGYHIELLAKLNIRNVDIYEPDINIFFLSLFIIDYEKIILRFNEPFKRIQFYIGKTPEEYIESVFENTALRRRFIVSNTHIYQHYSNSKMNSDLNEIINLWHKVFQANGFIEDEFHGLNQYRLKLEYPIRHISKTTIKTEIPCFIMASGPSIDQQIEIIKKISHKVCIISCSSSISICHKNGIIPDFHVETERGYEMVHYCEQLNDTDYLKEITLLALTVVHPKFISFFKNVIIGIKPNDLGSAIVKKFNTDDIIEIEHCHPTSANGAFSFSIALGFKEIIMIGTDLGFRKSEEHHSRNTHYFEENKKWSLQSQQSTLQIKAIDGGTIGSTPLLEQARTSFELMRKLHPELDCKNASNGALIRGFENIILDQICEKIESEKKTSSYKDTIYELINKNSSILNNRELADHIDKDWKNITNTAKEILEKLDIYNRKVFSSKENLFDLLEIQRDEYIQLIIKSEPLHCLLGGTLSSLQILASIILGQVKDGPILENRMNMFFKIWTLHLRCCIDLLETQYMKTKESISIEAYRTETLELMRQYKKQPH